MSESNAEDHLSSAENKKESFSYRRGQWILTRSKLDDMLKRMWALSDELGFTGGKA